MNFTIHTSLTAIIQVNLVQPLASLILYSNLVWTSASSQRTFHIHLNTIPLYCRASALSHSYLHRCTISDPISIISAFNTSKPPESTLPNHQVQVPIPSVLLCEPCHFLINEGDTTRSWYSLLFYHTLVRIPSASWWIFCTWASGFSLTTAQWF